MASERRTCRMMGSSVLRAFLCFQVGVMLAAGQASTDSAQPTQQQATPQHQAPPQQQAVPQHQAPPQQQAPPQKQAPPQQQAQPVAAAAPPKVAAAPPRPLSAAELAAQGAALEAEQKAEAQRKRQEELHQLLHNAVNSGNKTAVDEALAKGANINSTDASGEGWTVMYDVASKCYTQSAVDMAKYLILKGANVDQADTRGRTPLYHAARYNGTECVREFLKVAKNLNTHDGDGVTAVTRAIWKGHADIAKMIYDAGVAKADQQVTEHAETHGKTSDHPHIRRLFGGVEQAPKQASTFAATPATPEKPKVEQAPKQASTFASTPATPEKPKVL